MKLFKHIRADCVVVGSGAAGIRSAIECLENDVNTLLITKGVIGQSHSLLAEGGINAAIGQKDPTDNWEVHFKDTVRAGRFINNKKMAEILCKENPQRIYNLLSYGAGFETDVRGKPVQVSGPSGGQSKDRVVTVGDFIGFVLIRTLLSKALSMGLKVLDEAICIKLILDNDEVAGIIAYSLRDSRFTFVESPCVILASGGAGRLFSRTTNPADTTGEGYILGLEAGVELRDMEMIQFHPTALCFPPCIDGVLVTEAARGVGGRLYNAKGERFMEKYEPDRMELAPRDIVARAITQEVREGRGGQNGGVFLDLTHLNPDVVLPRLHNTAKILNLYQSLDIMKHQIEVAPAAHHIMGGLVPHNVETMETTVSGIFLAGEICWGCHGANRLGGNALAETQVFGSCAGRGAVVRCKELLKHRYKIPESKLKKEIQSIIDLFRASSTSKGSIYEIRKLLGEIMYKYVGIIRDAESLETADKKMEEIEKMFYCCEKTLSGYYSFAHIFECSKMITLAKLIIQSAMYRKESRGAHFRRDYPRESSELYNTSIVPQIPYKVERVGIKW